MEKGVGIIVNMFFAALPSSIARACSFEKDTYCIQDIRYEEIMRSSSHLVSESQRLQCFLS